MSKLLYLRTSTFVHFKQLMFFSCFQTMFSRAFQLPLSLLSQFYLLFKLLVTFLLLFVFNIIQYYLDYAT